MKDVFYLGATPYDEECAQVGDENYRENALRECEKYKAQLTRQFPELLKVDPNKIKLRTKANSHDFGTYYEVVVEFDDSDRSAVELAYIIEASLPARWAP